MTNYVSSDHFVVEEPLDQAALTSQVVTSAATALDTLAPLNRASERVQNVVTILHVSGDGDVLRTKIALAGKAWGKKMDAKRLFKDAPPGSKLVIKNLDVAGMEFPPGEKTSLWVPSSEFDWSVNKSNNQ